MQDKSDKTTEKIMEKGLGRKKFNRIKQRINKTKNDRKQSNKKEKEIFIIYL